MGPLPAAFFRTYAMLGAPPRWVAGLAGVAGSLAVLAASLPGQAPWAPAAALALLGAGAVAWRRQRAHVAETLRVSDCGRHWQLGDARHGWQAVTPVARWQTGGWLTLDLQVSEAGLPAAAQQASTRPLRRVLWRGALAPQAWRRLAALSHACLARPQGLPETAS